MSLAGYKLSPQAAAKEVMWRANRERRFAPSAAAYGQTETPQNVSDKALVGGEEFWHSLIGSSSAERAEQAARNSAVFFCCSIIAIVVGSFPREFRDADGRHDPEMPIADLICDAPNLLQTGDEFWSSMAFRAALAGTSFAEATETASGVELWPLEPLRTCVDWEDRTFSLRYVPERGPSRTMGPQDVFWFSGLADSAAKPLTPWKMAKGSIDFALALEGQGRDFFTNGARLAGVLSTDQELSEEALQRLKAGVAQWRSGKIPVFEKGLSFKDVSSNNSDAQLVELIKQRTLELARYWHIPKSLIGEDSGSKATGEQEALDFARYCLRPWVRRIEQAVRQRLMTPDQRARWRFKLNMDGLLRADSATQFRNAVLARTAGTHSINDLREVFWGMSRIEEDWANDPREPLNSNRAADTMTGGATAPQDEGQE